MKIYHTEESSYISGEIREDTGDRGAMRGIENDRRGGRNMVDDKGGGEGWRESR